MSTKNRLPRETYSSQRVRLEDRLLRGDEEVLQITGSTAADILRFTAERVIVVRPFNLKNLSPGSYTMEIQALDPRKGTVSQTRMAFEVSELPAESRAALRAEEAPGALKR